jgi:hypothetical protein
MDTSHIPQVRLGNSRYGLQCLSSCLLTAFGLQCAAIGCEGVDQTSEPPLDDGHVEPPSCSRIETYGPDEAARVYTCSSPSSAVGWRLGFSCTCNDGNESIEVGTISTNCPAAIASACAD